jgi:hypothetical protein
MRSGLGQLLPQWGGAEFPPSVLCWPLITVRCFVLAPHLRGEAPPHPPLTGSTLPTLLSPLLTLAIQCVFRKALFSTLKKSLLPQNQPTFRRSFMPSQSELPQPDPLSNLEQSPWSDSLSPANVNISRASRISSPSGEEGHPNSGDAGYDGRNPVTSVLLILIAAVCDEKRREGNKDPDKGRH